MATELACLRPPLVCFSPAEKSEPAEASFARPQLQCQRQRLMKLGAFFLAGFLLQLIFFGPLAVACSIAFALGVAGFVAGLAAEQGRACGIVQPRRF